MKTLKRWIVGLVMVVLTIPLGTQLTSASPNHQVDCEDGDGFGVSPGLISAWPNTDFCNYIYASSNGFLSGGVGRDGIPPYYPTDYIYPEDIPRLGGNTPSYIVSYETVSEADAWLVDQHPVISLEIEGDARAYPLGLMTRHEIANTVVGGVPVAVTFCPLCNTGVVFDRRVDGEELHFGVSGFLRFSDLVMWDHETESWWQQSTGEGLVGDYAGTQLTFVTSSMTSYAQFKEQYPDGQVLSADGQSADRNPYVGYDTNDSPFLFNGYIDERLEATERVLGYRYLLEDETEIYTAYPFAVLEEIVVVNDIVNGEPRVVFWQPGAVSALDGANINTSREIGAAALFDATLEDGTILEFVAEGTTIKDTATGSTWNIFGVATEGELAGTQLRPVNAITHFWFAWQAFYSSTIIWEVGTTTDALVSVDR